MRESSKTVGNAIALLNCFSRSDPVLTAAEIARRLNLPRTNVLRLLVTLEEFNFVEKHPTGRGYQIGLRAFEVGTLYLTANPLSSLLVRALDTVVDATQCTAYLATLDKDDVVILTYREGTLPIRFIWREGDHLPCTTTALGKAMLMHMSDDEIDARLGKNKPLRGLTELSLRTRRQLDADLRAARRRGWALAREESHPGLTAVGAAVLNESGRPVAALSISHLDYPPDPQRLERFAAIVCEAAADVSKRVSDYSHYGDTLSRDLLPKRPRNRRAGQAMRAS